MSHLSTDRLAALADEPPAADEHLHLAECAACRRELQAHRSLLALAGVERETMGLPLTRWDTLAPRLRDEGLVADGPPPRFRSVRISPIATLRAAAAVLLVAGGTILGRISANASPLPGGFSGERIDRAAAAPARDTQAPPTTFASVEDASLWKDYYATGYQNALTFLAANDSARHAGQTPAVLRERLSALDRVSRMMREALTDAPYDPVINDFYLNSFGQREATLRQLNTVLPQGVRMSSF